MEDRYLFKAKTCNGEWVTGFLHCKDGKWYISNKAGSPFAYEVRPDTICQCTVLKDKNGNLILDNDIVNVTDVICVCVDGVVVNATDYNLMLNLYYSDELERVGNKFDNPELLESDG